MSDDELLSPHFKRSELACRHCGALTLDPDLLPALERLRLLAGQSITVLDVYRCSAHNAAVGGAPRSEHLTGEAADIRIGDLTPAQMFSLAMQVPAFARGGIGLYSEGTMHVDVRKHAAKWSRVHGVYKPITDMLSQGVSPDVTGNIQSI